MPKSINTPKPNPAYQTNQKILAGEHPIMQPSKQQPNRTVIDASDPDDMEVVIVPSVLLSNLACSLETLRDSLEHIGDLFWQIEQGQVKNIKAVAHLTLYSALYLGNHADNELQELSTILADTKYPVSEV